ncbi:hypothetical protein POM88_015130 [Heracleum sosnowskyi]|uniref:Uncharacterized protein n=1 Tax=Heracleum sosnowskyi TaxID=360622 RepID=A0AAD8IM91_9APIA|nr:hypothetical protein POM88_015130 [Heracleum sosnowskyi]
MISKRRRAKMSARIADPMERNSEGVTELTGSSWPRRCQVLPADSLDSDSGLASSSDHTLVVSDTNVSGLSRPQRDENCHLNLTGVLGTANTGSYARATNGADARNAVEGTRSGLIIDLNSVMEEGEAQVSSPQEKETAEKINSKRSEEAVVEATGPLHPQSLCHYHMR